MFAALLCMTVVPDPVVAAQLRYPVSRITVHTTSGSVVYYFVPRDAPPALWRAYKVLELAERDVIVTDSLQLLRLEYVQNERRLEGLRTNAAALAYMNVPGNPGPSFRGGLPAAPESSLKVFMSEGLARDATFERSLLAIDRLAEARYEVQLAWLRIAYPDRKWPAPPGPGAVAGGAPARP